MRDEKLAKSYETVKNQIELSAAAVQVWKLGGSNYRSRDLIDANQVLFGPLFESEVHFEDIVIKDIVGTCVELEIAIRERKPGEFEWALCLEFPNPKNPVQEIIYSDQMVTNRCDAGSMWISSTLSVSSVSELRDMNIRFRVGDSAWLKPDFESLVQEPTKLYREFIELAALYGVRTEPKQWVATGGVTPCMAFEIATELKIEARGKTFAQINLEG